MKVRDDIFKVKLGLKWTGRDRAWLARRLGVADAELLSALAGNNRAADRAMLRQAYEILSDELERQERRCLALIEAGA